MINTLHQALVFEVQGHRCALPVEDVGEVLRMPAVTPVPEAPAWLRGILSFRGGTMPVIDLRVRLDLAAPEPRLDSSIIVAGNEGRSVGLLVDSVLDVVTLSEDEIDPSDPAFGPSNAVASVGRLEGRPLMILDLQRICSGMSGWVAADRTDRPAGLTDERL